MESNLKTLKELILDEEKLVTYISLSKELCIHVNEAKSLLNHIIQDIRKMEPKTEIYVCYVISGLLNNKSACTTVCVESDLHMIRQTLKTVFYEHVYCVSKGMQDVDNVALTAINKFEDFPLCTGLIKANSCSKRTDSEISNLKSNYNHGIAIESKTIKTVSKTAPETKKELVRNGVANVKQTVEVKSDSVMKSKTPSPKKDSTKNNAKSNSKPTSKSIAGFFNKVNGDNNKANTKAKVDKEDLKVTIKVEKQVKTESTNNDNSSDKVKLSNTDKTISIKTENNEPSNETPAKKKSANSSLKQIKKNAKVDNKRKRVLRVSDSESENETNDPFADDENVKMSVDPDSEDEIPPTPTVNIVKITSGLLNPKKKRKIVDKTYTDEDGYVLTKKEEVYESCSDNEEETKLNTNQEKENVKITQIKVESSPKVTEIKVESPKKENSKTKKKKISPPQKGKQQMLTNFFKKV